MFHYLFPPLSIGLGVLLVVFGLLHRSTGDPDYRALGRFWTRVFAVNFTVGVATGIVMEFQFGSNWARFSQSAGDVFGSALAAEGIFAFFLESGFLAVLVFGWDRVSPRLHFFATVMVALGATFSARLDRDCELVDEHARRSPPCVAQRRAACRGRGLLGDGVQPVIGSPGYSRLARGIHPGCVLRDERLGVASVA